MIKLALIGKDIQHSRSKEIYKRLLKTDLRYDLLDYKDSSLIPSAADLFKIYDGISITSPYKKHFLDEIHLAAQAGKLGAINCLRKAEGKIEGGNTDYLAIMDILQKLKEKHGPLSAILLGDGVMSKVTQIALQELDTDFIVLSRKITANFDQLNIGKVYEDYFEKFNQKIVINTCSRDFVFKGLLDNFTIFWDFNYNFPPHAASLPPQSKLYMDGLEMLELQAQHALAFWSIKPSF